LKLFVDASALVAILTEEPDHIALAARLDRAASLHWSAMSCWEAINALRRSREYDLERAREEVEAFAHAKAFQLVSVGENERRGALEAYRRYGKGRHSARLNMGDCFAYACAKTSGANLLYKGNDFDRTDLAWADDDDA
jgi:ribonuclease VapC